MFMINNLIYTMFWPKMILFYRISNKKKIFNEKQCLHIKYS